MARPASLAHMQPAHYRPHPSAPPPPGQAPPAQPPPHYPPSYVTGVHTPRQPGPPPGHPVRGYGPPPPGYHQSPVAAGGPPVMARPPGAPPPPHPGGPGAHLTSEREAQQQYMVASLRSAGAPVSGNALVASGRPPPGTYYARPPGPGPVGQGRPGMVGPGGRMMHPGVPPQQQQQQQPSPGMHAYGPSQPGFMTVPAGVGPGSQHYPQYMHPAHPSQGPPHAAPPPPPAPPSITTSSPHPPSRPVQDPQHGGHAPPHPGSYAPQTYQSAPSPSSTPQLIHPNAAQSPLRAPDPPVRVVNGNLSVHDPQGRLRVATSPVQPRPPAQPSQASPLPPPQHQHPHHPQAPPLQSALSPAPSRGMHPPPQMMPRPIGPPMLAKTEPPHGSAILRLLQFFAGLADGETRSDLNYWQNHVHTYYTETGSLMYALKSAEDASKRFFELSCSSLPRYFLTSYRCGLRSIALNLENPRESRAPYSAQQGNRTITVDVSRASMTNIYTNDTQVVFRGALKCVMIFTPNEAPEGGGPPSGGGSLLIDRMEFNTVSFVEFIARASVKRQAIYRIAETAESSSGSSQGNDGAGGGSGSGGAKTASTPAGQAPTPGMTPSSTASALPTTKAADKGKGRESAISEVDEDGVALVDDAESGTGPTGAAAKSGTGLEGSGLVAAADVGEGSSRAEHDSTSTTAGKPAKPPPPLEVIGETVTMPDQVINAYGISDGALRCLEIAQTVGQMGPLMAFCQTQGVAPRDGLHRFADRYRSRTASAVGGSAGGSGGSSAAQSLAPVPHPQGGQTSPLPSAGPRGYAGEHHPQHDADAFEREAGHAPATVSKAGPGQADPSKATPARGSLKRKKSSTADDSSRGSTTPDPQGGPMTRRRSRITLNGDLPS